MVNDVEEQFQSLVFGAGLVAMLVGAVLGVGIVLASLWEG